MNLMLDILAAIGSLATLITIGGAFGILFVSFYRRKKIHANDIASFATTAGIFFTFLGIALALGGLENLDADAGVKEKIDVLLEGVLVAFIPSIFGALVAFSTHAWPNYWRKPITEDDEQESDIDAQILQELKRLNANIVGDSETSLTTRLEKFQLKVTENQDKLAKEFQDFAKNVAENIIQALQKSMDSLNEKLGQQFGENFKKFADAVPKLLDWQENYRDTIEENQQLLKSQSDHLKSLLESLDKARKAFAGIAEHVEKIGGCADAIDQSTQAISASLAQASGGVEKIKTNAEQLQNAAKSFSELITEQTEQVREQASALGKSADSLTSIAGKAVVLNETAQKIDKHIKAMESALGGFARLSDTLDGKAESIEKNMTKITEAALKELAGNLRGISAVLVKDYAEVQAAIQKIANQTTKSE